MVPTPALAGDLGTIPEHLSGLQDASVQTLALNSDPHEIAAVRELFAGGVSSQPSPMQDLLMQGQTFQEQEAKWYQHYEKLEAKFYQRCEMKNQELCEKSAEISRITIMALYEKTEKIKLEGNFNLHGALERTAYHGRLIGKIKSPYTHGVQAGLDELAKTTVFQEFLAEEIATRHLVDKDVNRCAAVVYHEASKHKHGNTSIITIYQEDHTANECAALATFLRVQDGWPGGLEWREVKRIEQTGY
ncbi:hypothetical protein HOY80DRAFT_979736 [Tuber brumale]|nr:hypothetical protein HOY80DRAFT_979736 [Tuber brumale]